MKQIFLLLIFFVFCTCSNAQITDTLTKDHFKELNFSEMKVMFKNDTAGLKVIKSYKIYRTIGKIVCTWGVLGSVNSPDVGIMFVTYGLAGHLLHTKGRLYNKLVQIEELRYGKRRGDTVLRERPHFDLTFEEFKKLSRDDIRYNFLYDDTSKYILDYSFHMMTVRSIGNVMMCFIPFSISILAISAAVTNPDAALESSVGLFPFLAVGAAGIPIYLYGNNHSSKRILYHRLSAYYKKGIIDNDVKDYIDCKRK